MTDDIAAQLKRLRAKLDGPNPRTTPLIVPAWAGPSGLAGWQVNVQLMDGRALVRVSEAVRENARKADLLMIAEAFFELAQKLP